MVRKLSRFSQFHRVEDLKHLVFRARFKAENAGGRLVLESKLDQDADALDHIELLTASILQQVVAGISRVHDSLQLCIDRLGTEAELHESLMCIIFPLLEVAFIIFVPRSMRSIIRGLYLIVLLLDESRYSTLLRLIV